MEGLDFSHFTRKIKIRSSCNQLWPLWRSSYGITQWFLQQCTFTDTLGKPRSPEEPCQAGDRYNWKWYNWDTVENGLILAADETQMLFEFAGSKVRVVLEESRDEVVLCLTQFDIPEDRESQLKIHFGCSNGWSFWLTNLKAFVEHGILLNERSGGLENDPLAPYHFVNI